MLEFHPAANIFPLMEGEEFEALCADIAANGLLEPIVTDAKTKTILDGRNRYRAVYAVGAEPKFEWYHGDDPVGYVVSLNLHRRHLNESQRAMVASKIANIQPSLHAASIDAAVSQPQAAAMLNVSRPSVQRAKQVIEQGTPELIAAVESGRRSLHEATKLIQAAKTQQARAVIAEVGASVPESEKWHVWQADIATWIAPQQYDFIITDPPYPQEFLPLYHILAERAKEWLKPGGLLVAMCGQSYLETIYGILGDYLDYYWTAAYLTPGQPTPLRQRQVNTTWKPLLFYVLPDDDYKGKIFGDVFVSDGNDKDHHKWGQSESGMLDVVSKICLPGQSILDPFCGAGTTGLAALKHGCLFDGIDLDQECVNIAKGRLSSDSPKE